jgi:hypothetical protein
MSRITEAATDVESEGKCLIRQLLIASRIPLAASACNAEFLPPPDMFLMQPIVYLPPTSKNNSQNGERNGVQHSVEVSTCLNNFRHQLQ